MKKFLFLLTICGMFTACNSNSTDTIIDTDTVVTISDSISDTISDTAFINL